VADLFFPDVSEFQPNIDGHALIAGGYPVIIVRAHNGWRPDRMMPARRDYLRTCGFAAIGWYQYLVGIRGAAEQARDLLNTVGPLQPNEFLVLDHEEGAGNQTTRAEQWFATINQPNAWIYSGASFMATQLSGTDHWAPHPTWVASYASNEPRAAHLAWQYTDGQYTSAGYRPISFPSIGVCDASVYHGTITDFLAKAGLTAGGPLPDVTPTPTPTPTEDNMVLTDPTTGGLWVVVPDPIPGAIWTYDKAPYLGGTNSTKYNAAKYPCVGITDYHDSHGAGYTIVLDWGDSGKGDGKSKDGTGDRFRRYHFSRSGAGRT
jgi:hypothetical protein